jgi:hypothetical protein
VVFSSSHQARHPSASGHPVSTHGGIRKLALLRQNGFLNSQNGLCSGEHSPTERSYGGKTLRLPEASKIRGRAKAGGADVDVRCKYDTCDPITPSEASAPPPSTGVGFPMGGMSMWKLRETGKSEAACGKCNGCTRHTRWCAGRGYRSSLARHSQETSHPACRATCEAGLPAPHRQSWPQSVSRSRLHAITGHLAPARGAASDAWGHRSLWVMPLQKSRLLACAPHQPLRVALKP